MTDASRDALWRTKPPTADEVRAQPYWWIRSPGRGGRPAELVAHDSGRVDEVQSGLSIDRPGLDGAEYAPCGAPVDDEPRGPSGSPGSATGTGATAESPAPVDSGTADAVDRLRLVAGLVDQSIDGLACLDSPTSVEDVRAACREARQVLAAVVDEYLVGEG